MGQLSKDMQTRYTYFFDVIIKNYLQLEELLPTAGTPRSISRPKLINLFKDLVSKCSDISRNYGGESDDFDMPPDLFIQSTMLLTDACYSLTLLVATKIDMLTKLENKANGAKYSYFQYRKDNKQSKQMRDDFEKRLTQCNECMHALFQR